MTVNFKFEYVLNLHNKHSYIAAIEKDGVEEDIAYRRSLVQIKKGDIKSVTKTSDGSAVIIRKSINPPLTTIEDYDEILDTIQKANLALDIMRQEKIYMFDDFEVDGDELNVCEAWHSLKDVE
jgi:predicted RNase H-like nuclease (RuvC/YqgF family)